MTNALPVEIRILRPNAKKPVYQTIQSAGLDLYANIDEPITIQTDDPAVLIPTGIAISIRDPEYAAFIYPRSGKGHKEGLVLGNGVGVIDSDYQGELFVSAWNRNPSLFLRKDMLGNWSRGECLRRGAPVVIRPNDRIAQLVFQRVTQVAFTVVDEFTVSTARGDGGFGSTGSA